MKVGTVSVEAVGISFGSLTMEDNFGRFHLMKLLLVIMNDRYSTLPVSQQYPSVQNRT